MTTADLLADWAAQGRYHFTTRDVATDHGSSLLAARAALRRLRVKNAIAMPSRGFWVIVSPEHRQLGCLPPEEFVPQLMAHLGLRYYAALLSAARLHGAAARLPPATFQVMVEKNRPRLSCGAVRVGFVARRNVARIPTLSFETRRGPLRVSSAEATAFDLAGYPAHVGGLEAAAAVLAQIAGSLAPDRLAALAPLSPVPWSQRLGYLLSRCGAADRAEVLAEHVARVARETVPLDPRREALDPTRDARWKVFVNVTVSSPGRAR